LKFNLKDIFGVDVQDNEALRLAMAEALLTKIIDKTQGNKSRTGKPFKKYSKSYMNSLDFKAAGKTGKVNLTLSGDMLGLIDVTDESRNTVTLGWEESDEQGKAHGHITGNPKTKLPIRDFFGLNEKDLREVKNKFSDEISTIKTAKSSERDRAILRFIKSLEDDTGG